MKNLMVLACLIPAVCAAEEISPRPFNVLFIPVADLRPELGCNGNRIVKTPNIDRLAARGIVFDRAYCQQAVCSPSCTAIMTGLRLDVTTKLYNEQHDPTETVSLADEQEHHVLLANLAKYLPHVSYAATASNFAPEPKATPSTTPADETCTARFTRLYPGEEQLTAAEYIAVQGKVVAAAKQRFARMNKNNDGILTRAEFSGESNSKEK